MIRTMVQRTTARLERSGSVGELIGRHRRLDPAQVPPALSGGPYQCLRTDVGDLWMSVEDEVIRPFIQRTGTWEPEEGELLRRLIQPGCRFLDIGANVGYFSLLASRAARGVEIDAVEPVPVNLELLRFNLWSNGVDATVWPLALDDSNRAVGMSVAPTNWGDSRAQKVQAGEETAFDLVVAAARADDVFDGRGFDVIKIDTQGWEIDILTGMRHVLTRSPRVTVVSEFMPSALRARDLEPVDVLRQFRSLGLDVRVQVASRVADIGDGEIMQICDTAGETGQVNLVLSGLG
jgi:FkbM family methyltransferase